MFFQFWFSGPSSGLQRISHKPAGFQAYKRPIPNGFDKDFSSDGRFPPKTLRREMFRLRACGFAAGGIESRARE
ncbi:hypothetical protein [Sinorhizobium meliloti]|uniref:hypothetical protein n=1 Tax=Rhizobium meliloti TaxID=382 RepID=UPI000FD20D78|nr:hypothetical protein [Sinorhizobium meliloti]MDE4589311.1 hypothetical protein [Sinorhizobium meliloti]MDW9472300.1 hypothetical protein [Sinorhizobium meliloti]MDW9609989.1 hypothetical protein [Sinorhizobium meliloti]MDW9832946.1 hypothetical protein [Sinorhizobium meliloti]MDX0037179.1 hypothetical protein [Sinorhizobium meliloti]